MRDTGPVWEKPSHHGSEESFVEVRCPETRTRVRQQPAPASGTQTQGHAGIKSCETAQSLNRNVSLENVNDFGLTERSPLGRSGTGTLDGCENWMGKRR